jgi:hypothetical protein
MVAVSNVQPEEYGQLTATKIAEPMIKSVPISESAVGTVWKSILSNIVAKTIW